MAFTRSSLDHLLDVATSERAADGSVSALASALAIAADADLVAVFELDPRTRTQTDFGSADFSNATEADGAEDAFWESWATSPCSWTSPASPWFGRHPIDEPFAPERLYPTWRAYADTPMMRAYGVEAGLGHEVVIPLESQPGRFRRILVNRPPEEVPFTDADLTMFRLLQPHLERAVQRAITGDPLKERLSERELEILTFVRAGRSTREIAQALWVQPSTVRKHLENIYAKLGVHGRTEAIAAVWGHAGVAETG